MRSFASALAIAVVVGAAGAAQAITYVEGVDGDLDSYTLNIPVFALDPGVNTFSGTVSRLPTDDDRFKFSIPTSEVLNGISMEITSGFASPTGVNAWNPVLNFWGPSGYSYVYTDGLTMTTPTVLSMPATLFPATTTGLFEVAIGHGFGVSNPAAQLTYDYTVSIDVSDTAVVPLPGALGFGLLGLGSLISVSRRKRRSARAIDT